MPQFVRSGFRGSGRPPGGGPPEWGEDGYIADILRELDAEDFAPPWEQDWNNMDIWPPRDMLTIREMRGTAGRAPPMSVSNAYWRINEYFDWAAWVGDPIGRTLAGMAARQDATPETLLDRTQNVWIIETVTGPGNDGYDDRFGPVVHLQGWFLDREGGDPEVEVSIPLLRQWPM